MSSKIKEAAVKFEKHGVHSLPRPHRHHTVLRKFPMSDIANSIQGFIDENGSFLNRKDACQRAIETGQITLPKRTSPQNQLFSEDLW